MNKTNDNENSVVRQDKTVVILDMPYGKLHIEDKYDAQDHASMRASQLSALLLMTYGESQEEFDSLNETYRGNLLWLAHQMAEEVQALLPILAGRSKGEPA